jgi:hypothetical protein
MASSSPNRPRMINRSSRRLSSPPSRPAALSPLPHPAGRNHCPTV